MALRQDLEAMMQQCTDRDVTKNALAVKWIDRLESEGEWLLDTGRHNWVQGDVRGLNNGGNWDAYAMSVHLTYALENAGKQCRNAQKLIPGENSDVDIVYDDNGMRLAIECVAVQEPKDFWTPEQADPYVPGLYFSEISERGANYTLQMLKAQHKLRIKTVRDARDQNGDTIYTTPCKFPAPDDKSLHIIAADVSQALGIKTDYYDLITMCYGSQSVPDLLREGRVLGLFQKQNPYGGEFAGLFAANEYLRSRIHGILFLMDTSTMGCSLDPVYDAQFVLNPLVTYTKEQEAVTDDFCKSLAGLVQAWLCRPEIVVEEP